MESEIIRTVTDMDTGQPYVITRDSYKVYSQYEYLGWLITIRSFRPHSSNETLEAFATPTKFSHILDIDNYDDPDMEWEKELGLEKIFYPDDEIDEDDDEDDKYYYEDFMVHYRPDDSPNLGMDDDTSESCVLEYMVIHIKWAVYPNENRIYNYEDERKKLLVLKQIQRKSITPKTGKRKPGFMNQAWAALVKERDKKCTNCGSVYDLHAHHIKPYKNHPELRLDVNNGTTLCGSCHRDWHKKNGK